MPTDGETGLGASLSARPELRTAMAATEWTKVVSRFAKRYGAVH